MFLVKALCFIFVVSGPLLSAADHRLTEQAAFGQMWGSSVKQVRIGLGEPLAVAQWRLNEDEQWTIGHWGEGIVLFFEQDALCGAAIFNDSSRVIFPARYDSYLRLLSGHLPAPMLSWTSVPLSEGHALVPYTTGPNNDAQSELLKSLQSRGDVSNPERIMINENGLSKSFFIKCSRVVGQNGHEILPVAVMMAIVGPSAAHDKLIGLVTMRRRPLEVSLEQNAITKDCVLGAPWGSDIATVSKIIGRPTGMIRSQHQETVIYTWGFGLYLFFVGQRLERAMVFEDDPWKFGPSSVLTTAIHADGHPCLVDSDDLLDENFTHLAGVISKVSEISPMVMPVSRGWYEVPGYVADLKCRLFIERHDMGSDGINTFVSRADIEGSNHSDSSGVKATIDWEGVMEVQP